MDILARQASPCSGNKLWYVCTVGSFRGCCSSDPCTTGICPDDDSTSTSTSISSSTTSESSSIPETSSTATASPSATESTSLGGLASTTPASTTEATSAPTPTKTNSNGAIIGGVIGAVAGLIILALLLFFCWRRKRREKNTTLHRCTSSRTLHADATASPSTANTSPTEREPLRRNDSSSGLPNMTQSTTGSNANTIISGPSSSNLNLTGLSTISSMSTTSLASSSNRDLPSLPLMQIPPSSECPTSTSSSQGPRTPQELPDTGFYRQRAELASHNQSELINVPYRERRRKDIQQYRQRKPNSRSVESSPASSTATATASGPNSPASPGSIGPRLLDRKTARRVVTRDGVVLNANLETGDDSPGAESRSKEQDEQSSDDHVMSFMTYGGGSEMMARKNIKGDDSASAHGRTLMTTVSEESVPFEDEVLPPYDAGDASMSLDRDMKSPSGTMGGVQGARAESE